MSSLASKYQLGEPIGGGGMAEVFRATTRGAAGFERPMAVKRIKSAVSRDPSFGRMFVNEARIASLLHHPNIVSIVDFDRDVDGRYFLVMELVNGLDLRKLASHGRLPVPISVHIASEVLRALSYAHELCDDSGQPLRIVHRDISPHNVMLSWNGAVKVVDFGIAKAILSTAVSHGGSLKGKTAYMSPEQAHGRPLDGRSDLFAVGIILHELLTGRRLFRGKNEAETLALMLTAPIQNPTAAAPDVPADLGEISMRMVERDLERRYPNCRAALEALLACSAYSARAGLDLEQLLASIGQPTGSVDRGGPERDLARAVASPMADFPSTRNLRDGAATIEDVAGAYTLPVSEGSDSSAMATLPGAAGPAPAPPQAEMPAPPAPALGAAPTVQRVPLLSTFTASEVGRAGESAVPRARPARWWLVGGGLLLIVGATAASVTAWRASGDVAARARDPSGGPLTLSSPTTAVSEHRDTPASPASEGAADSDSHEGTAAEPEAAVSAAAADTGASTADGEDPATEGEPKRRGRARVELRASPWALIRIDGKVVGETPRVLQLSAGSHRIELHNPELDRRHTERLELKRGRSYIVSHDFD